MSSNDTLPFYECEYCAKKMAKFKTFEKHKCDRMLKFQLSKTKKGVCAFNDYKYWMNINGRKVKELSTFVDSKFFNTFVKFQDYANLKGIPDKKFFIGMTKELDIDPTFWQTEDLYEHFIRYYDDNRDPLDMVNDTLITLNKLSEILECDIGDVLPNLMSSEVSKLIFERRLSPWLLLMSKKFMHYLHEINDSSQYIMLTSVIDSAEWTAKFKKKPRTVGKVRSIISELNL